MKSIRKNKQGPKGYENYPYAKLYYYMFYKPGDIAVTTGQHWVLEEKSHREAQTEVKNGRIYNQLQKEKWKFDNITVLGIWNVSTHANISGHFAKNTEFDKFLNRKVFVFDKDSEKSEIKLNKTGFDSEQIVLKDIKDGPKRISEWLKTGNQPIEDTESPNEFTPRDALDEKDLEIFDKKFRKLEVCKLAQTKSDCIRACGAGKSQTPYLTYYKTYIDFLAKNENPINITLGPDNGIVRGNAMGMSGHDQAVGNNTLHLLWTSDALDDLDAQKRNNLIIVKPQNEIRDLKGKIVHKSLNKGEVFRNLLNKNKNRPIMIHCGYASYYQHNSKTCLSYQMQRANKSFYWAFIDEVHRTLNADWAAWSKIHDDNVVFIKHRFMPTATPNKLKSAKKDYNKMYGMGEFSDISFPKLDNVEAFNRGYIRKYKVWQLSFGDDLPSQIFEKISESREPYIKVKGTDITVPFKYWMELKSFYEFKIENPSINHTLGVTNRIANSRLFADFIDAVKKPMLLKRFNGNYNDPMYRKLINLHVEAMTTDEDDNGELRAKADKIGKEHKDSLLLHCQLLGEGWNPGATLEEKDKKYKGFIDSIQFIDPVHSKMRIAQNAGRGVRSPMLKPNCWLIMSWLNIQTDSKYLDYQNNYNQRAKILQDVAVSLGVPNEFVHDQIVLKSCKPITRKPTGPGPGPDYIDSDIEIDPFADEFLDVMQGIRDGYGAIHPLHKTAEKIAHEWLAYLKLNNYYFLFTNDTARQAIKEPFYNYIREHKEISKEILDWYLIDVDDPDFKRKSAKILRNVVDGKHVGNSLQTHIALDKANNKIQQFPQINRLCEELRKDIPIEILTAVKNNKEFRGCATYSANEYIIKYRAIRPKVTANFSKKIIKTSQTLINVDPLGIEVKYKVSPIWVILNTTIYKEDWFNKLIDDVQKVLDNRIKIINDIEKKYINMSLNSGRLYSKSRTEIKEKFPFMQGHNIRNISIWNCDQPSPEIIKIQKENLKKAEQYIEQKFNEYGHKSNKLIDFLNFVNNTMMEDIGVDPYEYQSNNEGSRKTHIVAWQFSQHNPNRKIKFNTVNVPGSSVKIIR